MNHRYNWLVLTLFLCGMAFTSSAQKFGEPLVDRIDKVLDLNESQKSDVSEAMADARKGYSRDEIKQMSSEERQQMKTEMMTKFVEDVEKVLTPAQKSKFAALKSKLLR